MNENKITRLLGGVPMGIYMGLKKPKRLTVVKLQAFVLFGTPEEIRTPDPLVRSQVLYPAELRAR
jgi:hypothetical protein